MVSVVDRGHKAAPAESETSARSCVYFWKPLEGLGLVDSGKAHHARAAGRLDQLLSPTGARNPACAGRTTLQQESRGMTTFDFREASRSPEVFGPRLFTILAIMMADGRLEERSEETSLHGC